MFLPLFYQFRASGLKVSLQEWLTLLEGLRLGLHESTLSGFYVLCRAVVAKSETDFDRFDQVFFEFFKHAQHSEEVSDALRKWLEHPELEREGRRELSERTQRSVEEIEKLFAERLQDQTEEHNGGCKWIGTSGRTAYGHHGKQLGGIRVGGEGVYRSAYRIAEERRYRDWRTDHTLDSRQFQMALRRLRQLSADSNVPKDELDLNETIRETCQSAGLLKIAYARPRKNAMKLLLLMDSGGSMEPYQRLCSQLFQAVSKVGHFKDFKIYYFHNYVSAYLYQQPTLLWRDRISTDAVLRDLPSDYRVILVGDGEMAMDELMHSASQPLNGEPPLSGYEWLLRFKQTYPHTIWLHPQKAPKEITYWSRSFAVLREEFPMFQLSLEGLSRGMKQLTVKQ